MVGLWRSHIEALLLSHVMATQLLFGIAIVVPQTVGGIAVKFILILDCGITVPKWAMVMSCPVGNSAGLPLPSTLQWLNVATSQMSEKRHWNFRDLLVIKIESGCVVHQRFHIKRLYHHVLIIMVLKLQMLTVISVMTGDTNLGAASRVRLIPIWNSRGLKLHKQLLISK